jgi:hypothetical protein
MRLWFSRARPRSRRLRAPFVMLAIVVLGATTAYGMMINAGWVV